MPSELSTEILVVDRQSKCYAFFADGEQQGNWMGYVEEGEPERIALEHDIALRERSNAD